MDSIQRVIIILITFTVFVIMAIVINNPDRTISKNGDMENQRNEERIVMENVNYVEIKGSQPVFKITAERGDFSFSSGEGTVEKIKGEIFLQNNRTVSVDGDRGVIKENGDTIVLQDNITGIMGDGTEFNTESMTYKVKENRIFTNAPIWLKDRTGTMTATSMEANLDRDIIRFVGDVEATIRNVNSQRK